MKKKLDLNTSGTIKVGDALPPLTKVVTQKIIDKWAGVSGDYNPLHVDPEYGKKTFFGTNIAHGPISLSYLIEMLTQWLGKEWFSGGRLYNVRLVAPVPPGTKIVAGGEVVDIGSRDGQRKIDCTIFVKKEVDGKTVITGNASCLLEKE